MKAAIALLVLCCFAISSILANDGDMSDDFDFSAGPLNDDDGEDDLFKADQDYHHGRKGKYGNRDTAPQTVHIPSIGYPPYIYPKPHVPHGHKMPNAEYHFHGDHILFKKPNKKNKALEKALKDLKANTDAALVEFYENLAKIGGE